MDNKRVEKIKKNLRSEAIKFAEEVKGRYGPGRHAALITDTLAEYILRDGKKLRPVLFILAYIGYGGRISRGLYRSALGFELLHDCALIHDDIIDSSDTRRGGLSLHRVFDGILKEQANSLTAGEDLAIAAGDVLYALGIGLFMSVKEASGRKEKALNNILDTAASTGIGQMLELFNTGGNPESIKRSEIMEIYDMKSSFYTFCCPLTSGAILAGASGPSIKKIREYGIYMGRAFQIRDDMKDFSGVDGRLYEDIRKSNMTLLLRYAMLHSAAKDSQALQTILAKRKKSEQDCIRAKKIFEDSGTFVYAEKEIAVNLNKARQTIAASGLKPEIEEEMLEFGMGIIQL